MSQTLNTRALNMLIARIIDEQNRRAEHVINGSASSFDEYRERTGFIKGLEFARQLCEGVESDLHKGK